MPDMYYSNPNEPQDGPAPQPQPYPHPYDASSARERIRNQAPQQPPEPDFSQMPSGKKSSTGLVIGIVAGCLVLILALSTLATSMISRSVEGLVENYFGKQTAPETTWNPQEFDWEQLEGIEGIEDLEELFDYYHDFGGQDPEGFYGTPAPASNDPAADDGELHDGWNSKVGYDYKNEAYRHENDREHVDAYDMDLYVSFSIDYPQLEGDLEHLDKINALIRDEAMAFATKSYLEPDPDFVATFKKLVDEEKKRLGDQADAQEYFLLEALDYAITYNSDKLISIVFSDESYAATAQAHVLKAHTLNINLETGEAYTIDDVMTVTDEMADHWIDNLEKTAGKSTVEGIGRDALKASILGEGEKASRTETSFFVDANGKVNLNVNWWFDPSEGGSRGWWDVTLTDDELAKAKKDSSFFSLL